ncbi:MAG: hypothetical protein WCO52_04055 [bacterium]
MSIEDLPVGTGGNKTEQTAPAAEAAPVVETPKELAEIGLRLAADLYVVETPEMVALREAEFSPENSKGYAIAAMAAGEENTPQTKHEAGEDGEERVVVQGVSLVLGQLGATIARISFRLYHADPGDFVGELLQDAADLIDDNVQVIPEDIQERFRDFNEKIGRQQQ